MTDTSLMAGRRGLIMGIANDHSIAWGIAEALHRHGAELALTYQGDAFARRVEPLAESLGANIVLPCDVSDPDSLDTVFAALSETPVRLGSRAPALPAPETPPPSWLARRTISTASRGARPESRVAARSY